MNIMCFYNQAIWPFVHIDAGHMLYRLLESLCEWYFQIGNLQLSSLPYDIHACECIYQLHVLHSCHLGIMEQPTCLYYLVYQRCFSTAWNQAGLNSTLFWDQVRRFPLQTVPVVTSPSTRHTQEQWRLSWFSMCGWISCSGLLGMLPLKTPRRVTSVF